MTISIAGSIPLSAPQDRLSAVRAWLYAVAALVAIMVIVGGATRLTGSGLSITEWRPLSGALPPLSEAAWLAEFDRYRAIPQYQLLNKGMSLGQFQAIYWWEWGHRQLGRLIGLAYLLPLAWFWWRGIVRGALAWRLLAIGLLGGFQGLIGWVMVASGLQPGMIAVAPVKLMLHLTVAMVIFASLLWTASGLAGFSAATRTAGFATSTRSYGRLAGGAKILVLLVLVQIALGALVAGSKAGLAYDTWPLMAGNFIPPLGDLFLADRSALESAVDNPTLVQFNHRMLAYGLLAFALWHAWASRRLAPAEGVARSALLLAGAVSVQAMLGILTIVLHVPLWTALAHQGMALLVLAIAVVHARAASTLLPA